MRLSPEYSLAYNQIVRPHLRWTATRYFAERWVPILGLDAQYTRQAEPARPEIAGPYSNAGKLAGRTGWAVVQFRQVVIWHNHDAVDGEHVCQRSLRYLAQESGLRPATIIEILKERLAQWFVRKEPGTYRYDADTQTTTQEVSRYRVRMDDPLIPADAECVYRRLAAQPVVGKDPCARAMERLEWALALDWTDPETHQRFLAADLRAAVPATYYGARPLEVIDLVCLTEPDLTPQDPQWEKLRRQCEALQRRVVDPDDVIGGTYYFRKEWVRRVGAGQSWAIILLRDKCYDRPGQPLRETCSLDGYSWLTDRTGADVKTIQRWFSNHTPERSPQDAPAFLRLLSSQRGADQRQSHHIWVAARDPLTGPDQLRYSALLAGKPPTPNTEPDQADGHGGDHQTQHHGDQNIEASPGVVDKSEITPTGVVDKSEITPAGVVDKPEISPSGVVDKSEQGTGQTRNLPPRGGGQIRTGYWTNPKRIESLIESSQSESLTKPQDAELASSSSSVCPDGLSFAAEEEEDDTNRDVWEWGTLTKGMRRANQANRQKIRQLIKQIPVQAYVANYLGNLSNLRCGNPVGLTIANLLEQAANHDSEWDAGVPYDALAARGPTFVADVLHRLGDLESDPSAISERAGDSQTEWEAKEAANRYLDTFGTLASQVRGQGKHHADAVQELRSRITQGLNELRLPGLGSRAPATPEASVEPNDDAGPEAILEPPDDTPAEPVQLDELGQPITTQITALEAWTVVYEKMCPPASRANEPTVATAGKWRQLASQASAKPTLPAARLIGFDAAAGKRFTVAVADQTALAQWQSREIELRLELGKAIHDRCCVQCDVTDRAADQTIHTIAGQWETMSPAQVWDATLEQLRLELSAGVHPWLRDTMVLSSTRAGMVVKVRDVYTKEWLEERLGRRILETVSRIVGRPTPVRFVVSLRAAGDAGQPSP